MTVWVRGETIAEFLAAYPWSADDIYFWTGTKRYQPWKDVAVFFRDNGKDKEVQHVDES